MILVLHALWVCAKYQAHYLEKTYTTTAQEPSIYVLDIYQWIHSDLSYTYLLLLLSRSYSVLLSKQYWLFFSTLSKNVNVELKNNVEIQKCLFNCRRDSSVHGISLYLKKVVSSIIFCVLFVAFSYCGELLWVLFVCFLFLVTSSKNERERSWAYFCFCSNTHSVLSSLTHISLQTMWIVYLQ